MRTTLKRGIGRAAPVNGNGGGNGRAVYPPGVLTPMRRYRVPPPPARTTRQLLGWIFRWTLAAIVMIAVGVSGGLYLYGHQTLSAFQAHSAPVKKAQKFLAKVPDASKPATALVIGYDKRAGADAAINDGSRSDTVMLIRADPQRHAVSLLSFPRDLVVPIHCPRKALYTDRINSAWSACGPQGTVATVEALTGIAPNYLVTVDFHGFKLLVNRLNGVYLDVDHRYLNTQGGPGGYARIDLEPGYQKLDGQQALDFVRFRHTDSDLYRLARQQEFVTALRERISSGFSIFSVFKIIGALKGNVEIVQGGGGPVPPDTALSYLKFVSGLPSNHFFRTTLGGLTGVNELSAPQSAIQTAVRQFSNPDVGAPRRANASALGLKARKVQTLKPASITTLVLNGTTEPGLARDTSYKLAVRGYRTVQLGGQQPANAPTQAHVATTVYFDASQPAARAAAQQLQTLFPGSKVNSMPQEIVTLGRQAASPMTIVVVGSSFNGVLAGSAVPNTATPKHVRPNVYASPGIALNALRAIRARLPFQLEVPHVIERSSQLAQLTPVRVYKPAPHHRGVRVTFVTGPGNVYWGIQETDWNDAPVLDRPTVTHTFGGRTFDFYYTGSHLHMVVLRGGKARYWVVNTLLDELSNETMIAIARGLQPLGR
ncbi:MAG: LCP family protein [Gaiellaceae bacterium]